jgi:hypothetical protein
LSIVFPYKRGWHGNYIREHLDAFSNKDAIEWHQNWYSKETYVSYIMSVGFDTNSVGCWEVISHFGDGKIYCGENARQFNKTFSNLEDAKNALDALIKCLSFKHDIPDDAVVIDATSNSSSFGKWLSPFYVGPIEWDGHFAHCIENLYAFSKVYPIHAFDDVPSKEYWEWAKKGWETKVPIKYPFGAWNVCLYHWWKGKKLNRLEAQNQIFVPLYKEAVVKTDAFRQLKELYDETNANDQNLIILDYEGYDDRFLELDFNAVMNHNDYPIGQAFVLRFLLEGKL